MASTSYSAQAFDSGSTGLDGAFNPTTNTVLQLPDPDGVFNFTDINIPAGVTVTFSQNSANTPVSILATGNIIINGVIRVSGGGAPLSNRDADDGQPGNGGPGGYDGGRGGFFPHRAGSDGRGPGGGDRSIGKTNGNNNQSGCGGGGGGYGSDGNTPPGPGTQPGNCSPTIAGEGGSAYGSARLLPTLIGGSGGGGGSGSNVQMASGGGGGGGAILLSATGTVTINGEINANGGNGGDIIVTGTGFGFAGAGGGGSGGAVRIVASKIEGSGTLTAVGGLGGDSIVNAANGGSGGEGRIRLEAEDLQYTELTTPIFSASIPSPTFAPNVPTIRIVSVGGTPAPAAPTGQNDITLPNDTPNPVDVIFSTSNIPTGGTIQVIATPYIGGTQSATSGVITGSEASGSATASLNLPNGPSVLIATTTFTVTASLGSDFSRYAKGETVEKVRVGINKAGQSETTFITKTGEEFTWLSNAIAMQLKQ